MRQEVEKPLFKGAAIFFNVLDPVPYGLFLAALIFDITYVRSNEALWLKSAAWLIAMGLLFAVVPRLINLVRVWFYGGRSRVGAEMTCFWLNFAAIAVAILNAFVHSRDAYGVMPEGLWLSLLTMILLVLAKVIATLRPSTENT